MKKLILAIALLTTTAAHAEDITVYRLVGFIQHWRLVPSQSTDIGAREMGVFETLEACEQWNRGTNNYPAALKYRSCVKTNASLEYVRERRKLINIICKVGGRMAGKTDCNAWEAYE